MYFRFYGWRHIYSQAKVARRRLPAEAQCTRSLGLGYKQCAIIPAAGRRTHGTTFRALKVLPRWQHRGRSLRSMWLPCFRLFSGTRLKETQVAMEDCTQQQRLNLLLLCPVAVRHIYSTMRTSLTCNVLILSGGLGYRPGRRRRRYSTFAPSPDTCPP